MRGVIADRLFPLLLKASWQGAVIILLALAARYVLGRGWNPRWRQALWWLALARLALPVTVPSPVSVFNVFPASVGPARFADVGTAPGLEQIQPAGEEVSAEPAAPLQTGGKISLWLWLWAAGALFMAAGVAAAHWRLHRSVTRRRPLTDEWVLNLLEDCKQRMGIRAPVTLVETAAADGPCLFGFVRPRLLLPPGFTREFSADELRYVFLHELGHVKRHDIALGWLMAGLQILHWFNPLVWLAFSRMRADRELACDALALSHAEERDRKPYGRAIVKLLESFGSSMRAPSLAGIVEDKQHIKERIVMIAKFQKSSGGFAAAACLLAGLGLVTLTDAQTDGQSAAASEPADGPPHIVATSPKFGATDVNPALKEITVTFDRDMDAGMSWTGGGPSFPKSPEGAKARWRDKRTCVLPVKLQAGHYYRVGINSPSYQNFCAVNGLSAAPKTISFRTRGTPVGGKAPEIVSLNPPNGTGDVSPAVTELRVTFNVAMSKGFSWCGAGPHFPATPDGKKPYWTDGGKTCVLPVELKPGWDYQLGINSQSFTGFQSEDSVPSDPVVYSFKTGDKP
jgi:beta-lactamase regulating signal transducer with metallopeptidase domain